MPKKLTISREEMASRYTEDRRCVQKIATEYGVSIQAVYEQMERMGIQRRTNGESHLGIRPSNWKGGSLDSYGYLKVHRNGKQVKAHRLVAERMLGRPLKPGEVIHHKNGIKLDNREENLEVFASHAEHMRQRHGPPALKALELSMQEAM